MPTKEDSRYRSSSWWDVKVYCLEVGKAHNGYVVLHTVFDMPERVNKAACWTACWYPRARAISEGYTMGVSEYWPHTDYTAVTDMVMRMIFDLDWKLTERETIAKRQAKF